MKVREVEEVEKKLLLLIVEEMGRLERKGMVFADSSAIIATALSKALTAHTLAIAKVNGMSLDILVGDKI